MLEIEAMSHKMQQPFLTLPIGPSKKVAVVIMVVAVVALAVFQIPTSVLFEDSLYESFDSISALGGVLAVAVSCRDEPPSSPPRPRRTSGWGADRRDDPLLPVVYT